MSRSIETGFVTNRKVSRRRFLNVSGNGVAGLVLGVGIFTALVKSREALEKRSEHWIATEGLRGLRIEGEGNGLFVTYLPEKLREIPVRSVWTRDDDNIVGYAKLGQTVMVEDFYYGVVYPGIWGLGQFYGPDGKLYGKWAKLIGVTVTEQSGSVAGAKGANDVFVAAHFVKEATDEQRQKFNTSSG